MSIPAYPLNVNFGGLRENQSKDTHVTIDQAPSDGVVTASISGNDASSFRVIGISSYEWVLEEVDPSELPPHAKGHPKVKVLEQVAQANGGTPLSVTAGQLVQVQVGVIAPASFSNKDNLSALLQIEGWGDSAIITLSARLAYVLIDVNKNPDGSILLVPTLSTANKILQTRLVAGPSTQSTTMNFLLHNGPEEDGIALDGADRTPPVTVPRGAWTPVTLTFSFQSSASGRGFHVFSNPEVGVEGEVLVFTTQ